MAGFACWWVLDLLMSGLCLWVRYGGLVVLGWFVGVRWGLLGGAPGFGVGLLCAGRFGVFGCT